MAENSKISWTHHTVNLWSGCVEVHTGCDHCYAATLSRRWGNDVWGNDKPRKFTNSAFSELEKYQKKAASGGEIHRVFVGSMMDIFEKPMPLINAKGEMLEFTTAWLREQFFQYILEGKFPNLLFLLLTKRPSNINKYIPEAWKTNPPQNVMFGTSIVDVKTAALLTSQLLTVNGYRFLSVEPQIARIPPMTLAGIDWLIQGGESGPGARPFQPEWVTDLHEACKIQNVAYFFKQTGSYLAKKWGLADSKGGDLDELPVEMRIQEFPNIYHVPEHEQTRNGTKKNGRRSV